MRRILAATAFAALALAARAQTVTVKDTVMTTYPYADPDPVPRMGNIYPYWHFNTFTTEPSARTWKIVVLENDYIRVKVFPEIGGKIWSIYDKTSGQELFYDNDAVKFREISLRGPWTSGGIEFNYGVIGHAASCSSPVNWTTSTKPDGSVSCYIGVLDMVSRSHWTIEVNLPKDAAWVRTSSIWHNCSSEYQPYYSWANSGIRASDDLVLVYPGRNAIGHGGDVIEFPMDSKGRDLSHYSEQAFGRDKSYHVVGSHKPFFGAWYRDDDWGLLHYSMRDDKLGRKYFTWAQSEQGSIWVDLLTDGRTQYVEMQSGRLFNQNNVSCSASSPFRQFLFNPYGTDEWTEYWLPYKGIGAADNVTLDAVVSVSLRKVGICPLRPVSGCLEVTAADGGRILEKDVSLKPMEALTLEVAGAPASVRIAGRTLWTSDDELTSRPQKRSEDYDDASPSARMMMARDLVGMRMYADAEEIVDTVLASAPSMIEALSMKAALTYHRMAYEEALGWSDKALAVDQYDPEAGLFGGLAAAALGRDYDALDRLEVASIAPSTLRSSCQTELACLRMRRGERDLAAEYARKALVGNAHNITALQILYLTSGEGLSEIEELDPLSHFPQAVSLLGGSMDDAAYAASFQQEASWEDCLEMAIFFHKVGMDAEAARIASAAETNALTSLWAAYLTDSPDAIAAAAAAPLSLVHPFRQESAQPLRWALAQGGGWQFRYLLALLQEHLGNHSEAEELMVPDDSDCSAYYAFRYRLCGSIGDIRKAYDLDPDCWQYRVDLAKALTGSGNPQEAVSLLKKYYAGHSDCIQAGDALVDAYIAAGDWNSAEKIMDSIVYLPFEGQHGSHDKYRRIKLHQAAAAIDRGAYSKASGLVDEALLWPSRLGAGKPYDEYIDTSVEDSLKAEIERRKTSRGPFESAMNLIGEKTEPDRKLF